MTTARRRLHPIGRFLGLGLGVLGITVLLFFLVEGLSSTLLFLRELKASAVQPPTERVHTRYNPLLGWTGIPNLTVKDLYGPGKHLTTNSRGFRGGRDIGDRIPAGKLRLLCSGDSFTLGYGVGDDHTWCQLLALRDPQLEAVNMGQGGYGLDQAYLWYARDGVKLDHDVLIFAFITEDFRRMQRTDFLGYGKPVLRLRDGTLAPENVPVPRRSYSFPWWTQNAPLFRKLRSIELTEKIFGTAPREKDLSFTPSDSETWKVALKVFETLHGLNQAKGSTLVLLSLPDAADHRVDKSDHWRASLRAEAARRGIVFVDLVDEIRKLPSEEVPPLFRFHYTEKGNEWVASVLYEKLLAVPEISRKLAQRSLAARP